MKRQRDFKSRAVSTQFKRPRFAALGIAPFQAPSRRRRRMQPRIGGFTGIEKKFVDYTLNGAALTTIWAGGEQDEGTALSMSAIGQGDGESQRDGRVATLHSWFVKGFFTNSEIESSVAPLADTLVRIAVVLDKQSNGAQLNAEDVFDTVGASQDVNSVKNLQNSARFKVLKDMTRVVQNARANTNEGAVNLFAQGQTFTPFKMGGVFNPPIRVNHTGTGATIATCADNSIHVIATGTQTTGLLSYRSRVRFTG